MSKIALITGATSGIGEACARKFAEGGYNLILTGRKAARLEEIRTKIMHNSKSEVYSLCFDVRDTEKAKQAIAGLPKEWQAIDVLINNDPSCCTRHGAAQRGTYH